MLFQYDSLHKIISEALQKFNIEGDVEDWALMNENTRRFITEQVMQYSLYFVTSYFVFAHFII